MLAALSEALRRSPATTRVRAVVLAANGPAFCAGHDLKEMTARRSRRRRRPQPISARMMERCSAHDAGDRHPAPAGDRRGRGLATAAGCQLVASCDLAVASSAARFCHARRRYRPVLLDADGGAVAQRGAQARHGDAAHRRHRSRPRRRRASGSSTGVGAGRPGRARRARAGPQHRREILPRHRHRQGGVLPPARDAARRGLRLRHQGDGREHDGARRRGRHRRLHRQARSRAWEDR